MTGRRRSVVVAASAMALSGCGLLGFDASSDDESTPPGAPGAPTTPTTLPDGAPAPPPEPAPVGPIADAGTLSDARAPGIDVVRLEALTELCSLEEQAELEVVLDFEKRIGGPWGPWTDPTIGGSGTAEYRDLAVPCLGKVASVVTLENIAMYGGGFGYSLLTVLDGRDYEGIAFLAKATIDGPAMISLNDMQSAGTLDPSTGTKSCYRDTDLDGLIDTGKDADGDGIRDPLPRSEGCTSWGVRAYFEPGWALHLIPWSVLRQDPTQGKVFEAPDGYVVDLSMSVPPQPFVEIWFDSIAFYRTR